MLRERKQMGRIIILSERKIRVISKNRIAITKVIFKKLLTHIMMIRKITFTISTTIAGPLYIQSKGCGLQFPARSSV